MIGGRRCVWMLLPGTGCSRFMGKGLLSNRNHEQWHKQRRIMDPAFSRTLHFFGFSRYLIGLMGTFNEKAEEMMGKLQEKADGKCHVAMHTLLSRTTLDVISKVAFGMEMNSLENDETPFPRAISLVLRALVEMFDPFIRVYMFLAPASAIVYCSCVYRQSPDSDDDGQALKTRATPVKVQTSSIDGQALKTQLMPVKAPDLNDADQQPRTSPHRHVPRRHLSVIKYQRSPEDT
ncbi:unnamed protein product [Ranitomeya imitator]|uniref:Uncharacterized protein n=1 Tax=Ranitomeya imitator TaxID=111125 RepID=A0ABN9KTT5_9NEOB|nr:unnamed protein product [Ranitomeya imitator]